MWKNKMCAMNYLAHTHSLKYSINKMPLKNNFDIYYAIAFKWVAYLLAERFKWKAEKMHKNQRKHTRMKSQKNSHITTTATKKHTQKTSSWYAEWRQSCYTFVALTIFVVVCVSCFSYNNLKQVKRKKRQPNIHTIRKREKCSNNLVFFFVWKVVIIWKLCIGTIR